MSKVQKNSGNFNSFSKIESLNGNTSGISSGHKDNLETILVEKSDTGGNSTKTSQDFYAGLKKEIKQLSGKRERNGLFTIKPANQWMEESKLSPFPRMLFGEFWFENELCILFADTNQGKSILAVQIGDSISCGIPIPGFKLETGPQKVLYFDFELSAKQFESRYSIKNEKKKRFEDHYRWSPNFIRVEINPRTDIPEGLNFEEYLNQSLEQTIIKTNAKVLIIDNLTYLKSDTEKSKDAAPLVKGLQLLIDKYNCSILVLAHTPKRDLSKPITRNDLQGSKRLIDFCDSAIAIGESHTDKSVKYFKQIKVRAMEFMYDSENVIVCQLIKSHNFLRFEFLNFASEKEHLKQYTEKDKEQRIIETLEMKQQGLSNVEIARRFCCSEGAVRKWLKKAENRSLDKEK